MTRSAGTRIIAGATPTLTSVNANVLDSAAAARSTGGDEAQSACPGVPVHAGDDRHGALHDAR